MAAVGHSRMALGTRMHLCREIIQKEIWLGQK